MSRFLRVGFIAFGLLVFFYLAGASEAKAQGVLREILNRMDAHNKALTSLQAEVTMVKLNSQLGENDTYSGLTKYLPKSVTKKGVYARVDWSKPRQEHILVIGDAFKLYVPDLNEVKVGKTDSAKGSSKVGNVLAFMSMSKAELQANYQTKYVGEESVGGTPTWHLELIPTQKASYKSAELWIDKDGMPIQMKVNEQNGDTTTVRLSNIKKNEKIKGDDFKLDTGNAKVVKV